VPLVVLLSAWAIGYEMRDTMPPGLGGAAAFRSVWPDIAFAAGGLLLIRRAFSSECAWALIGVGALCWAAGDTYWTLKLSNLSSPPVPSWADLGYLPYCPFLGRGDPGRWSVPARALRRARSCVNGHRLKRSCGVGSFGAKPGRASSVDFPTPGRHRRRRGLKSSVGRTTTEPGAAAQYRLFHGRGATVAHALPPPAGLVVVEDRCVDDHAIWIDDPPKRAAGFLAIHHNEVRVARGPSTGQRLLALRELQLPGGQALERYRYVALIGRHRRSALPRLNRPGIAGAQRFRIRSRPGLAAKQRPRRLRKTRTATSAAVPSASGGFARSMRRPLPLKSAIAPVDY
jgi:hypothetical protein